MSKPESTAARAAAQVLGGSAHAEETTDLKIAVIGAGGAGAHAVRRIYPCLSRLPVDLVAVCDLDLSLAERVARNFGARSAHTDYRKMLEEVELDAVIVCIGPDEHAKLTVEIMEAGYPVYTEKPASVNAPDARRILEASERTGQICMTAYCKRFSPAYVAAKAAIDKPDFGTPRMLTIDWSIGPGIYANLPDTPRYDFLLDFGIHAIDTARYLVGEVAEVYARKQSDDGTFVVQLVFANGALGVISMTDHRSELRERLELVGDEGNTVTVWHGGSMLHYRAGEAPARYERPFAVADSLIENGYQGELAEFVNAVREAREPESSIASSHQTMRLYDAILRSANEQRVVALEEIE